MKKYAGAMIAMTAVVGLSSFAFANDSSQSGGQFKGGQAFVKGGQVKGGQFQGSQAAIKGGQKGGQVMVKGGQFQGAQRGDRGRHHRDHDRRD